MSPSRLISTAAAAATLLIGASALAQREDAASARQIFEQDRAACMAGQTQQSRADCLYEARSALRDRLAGGIGTDDAGSTGGSMTASTGSASSDADMRAPRADRN